jgi:hypothetical protein
MHDQTRPFFEECESVYNFIRAKARRPQDQLTSDVVFNLLVNKQGDRATVQALERIVKHPDFGGETGLLFINRCIYTAINPLHLDASRHDDLKRLVQKLASAPKVGLNPTTKRLRYTLQRYVGDEKYQCVLRQARLYRQPTEAEITVLGDLFPNYTFVYLRASITADIERFDDPAEQDQNCRRRNKLTRGMRLRQRERIYEVRRALNVYHDRSTRGVLMPGDNPTRLTNQELNEGIYTYNTRRRNSYRKQAEQFRQRYGPGYTVSECRADVLSYMNIPLQDLPPQHRDRFQEDFHRALQTMETTEGSMTATVIQAFKKILDNLLFAGYETRKAHFALERYVNAISPCKFAAILLNLVLGCPMVLHKLEERLTAIYIHHEKRAIQSLQWLVKFFEFMHLALVMNFRYFLTHDPRDNKRIPHSIILP